MQGIITSIWSSLTLKHTRMHVHTHTKFKCQRHFWTSVYFSFSEKHSNRENHSKQIFFLNLKQREIKAREETGNSKSPSVCFGLAALTVATRPRVCVCVWRFKGGSFSHNFDTIASSKGHLSNLTHTHKVASCLCVCQSVCRQLPGLIKRHSLITEQFCGCAPCASFSSSLPSLPSCSSLVSLRASSWRPNSPANQKQSRDCRKWKHHRRGAGAPLPPAIPPSTSPSPRPTRMMTSSPSFLLQLFLTPPLPPHHFALFNRPPPRWSLWSWLWQSIKSTNQHPWEPSRPLLHHVTATSRRGGRRVCCSSRMYVQLCVCVKIWGCLNLLLSVWPPQSKRLLNIAAFSFLWSVRAAFFLPYTASYQHLTGFLDA